MPVGWRARAGLACAALAIVFLGTGVAALFEPIALPSLSGPHPVAKTQWVLRSESRRDDHDPDPFARREFLVNAYYPTRVNAGLQPAAYTSPGMAESSAAGLPWPKRALLTRALRSLRSQAVQGTGLSPDRARYPVVVFSPGYGYVADMHGILLEQLASHGYAVFAVSHPGDAPRVDFPDGRVRRAVGWSAHDARPQDEAERRRETAAFERALQALDVARELDPAQVRQLHAHLDLLRRAPLSVRRDDLSELLDRLQALDAGTPSSMWAGRLDLERVAVVGMSYGGPTAQELCIDDARCKAVVNLDGEEFGRLPLSGHDRPVLWMYVEGEWEGPRGSPLRRLSYDRHAGPACRVGLAGARHESFTDWPYYLPPRDAWRHPLSRGWLGGRTDREVPLQVVAYTRDFLAWHLEGTPSHRFAGGVRAESATVLCRPPT